MNYTKKIISVATLASISVLTACGDSASSTKADSELATPQDSTTLQQPGNNSDTASIPSGNEGTTLDTLSGNQGESTATIDSTESSIPMPQILSFEEEMARDSLFVEASADTGFSSIESVYQNLAPGERVIFLIRHAKRITNTSKEATLVHAGIVQSQTVGAKLASKEAFAYGHTDFVRTQQTAENIAIGRGETFPGSVVIPELTEDWYIKDHEKLAAYDTLNDPSLIYSQWAYNDMYADAFNDLKTSCVRAITELLLPKMSETARVNIIVSHDMFIGPLTVYCTNKKVNRLRYWETDMWVYFVSGLAIIVKPNGERRYIAIDGVDYDS